MGLFSKNTENEDVSVDGLMSFLPPFAQKKAANYLIKLAQKGHEGKKIKSISLSLLRDTPIDKREEMDFMKVFEVGLFHFDLKVEFEKLKEINKKQFAEITELKKRINNLKK